MDLLTNEEIGQALKNLELEWAVIDGVHLERVYVFDNFSEALSFVNTVGGFAEKQNHHPDILLHDYKKVTIRTTTHDANGLTKKDFEIAHLIDKEMT